MVRPNPYSDIIMMSCVCVCTGVSDKERVSTHRLLQAATRVCVSVFLAVGRGVQEEEAKLIILVCMLVGGVLPGIL